MIVSGVGAVGAGAVAVGAVGVGAVGAGAVGAGAVGAGSGSVGRGGSAEASCSRPHRGHVHVVAPGFEWKRDPHDRQTTNPQSVPHDEHV